MKIESAREMYQTAVGSHPDQSEYLFLPCQCIHDIGMLLSALSTVKRGQLPESLAGLNFLDDDWRILGLTQSTYDPGLLQYSCIAFSHF